MKSLSALACALAPPAWVVPGQAAAAAFDDTDLQADFAGELVGRGSAAYDVARRTDNLAFDRRPLVVARCANADDAARALEFARRRSLPLAVRGGGHCQAGRSSCDDGVVIDLGRLDGVTVDPRAGIVECGAGARIWQANEAAAAHGLSLPLGTCGDVGVSGLTLGGGVGYLMGVAGAACDALIAADILLADGRRLTVSAASDPDLMWALRGAGANFGIVTRFVFRAVRLEKVLAGMLTFPPASAHDVLALSNTLSATLPDELSVITQVVIPPGGDWQVEMGVCWAGHPAHGRGEIERLIAGVIAPLQQPLRETTLAEFVGRGHSGGIGPNCARYGLTHGRLPDRALNVLLEPSEVPALRLVFLDPVHGAVTRQPGGATSFPRGPSGVGVGFILGWRDTGQTRSMREWADRAWGELEPDMSQAYVNMLDDEGEARVREAYGANFARLQHLKARYDPDNVFRSNQNIEPARLSVG